MKNLLIIISVLGIIASASCSSGNKEKVGKEPLKPLNISIYLDLSDRLLRNDITPDQTYRDTAIVNYLVDFFKEQTLGPTILKSENKIKVFFYPTPENNQICKLASDLSVDIGEKKGVDKRKAIEDMKTSFQNNLKKIYEETLNEKRWIGCDIWDFFSNKKVDDLCIKKGARNIVIILTDGYIFAEYNKIKEGNAYSYILPQTLEIVGSSLIDRRKGELKGKGLEVLMLEVNPYQPSHRDKMVKTIEDWFSKMGVEKIKIAETDANLTNTQTIIKNFLEN